jgi:copper(I)-binding protein
MTKAALIALAVLAGPALAHASDVQIRHPAIRASIGRSPNTAAYLTIVNSGDRPERLLSVRCGCASMVMVHKTEMAGGMAKMNDAQVTVPAHGEVAFRPDGLHLMVMGLTRPLVAGGEQPLTLIFEHAGAVTVRFKVEDQIDAAPAPAQGSMPGMTGMAGMAGKDR